MGTAQRNGSSAVIQADLAFATKSGVYIAAFDGTGGREVATGVCPVDRGGVRALALSPGGRSLAFICGPPKEGRPNGPYLLDLASGNLRRIADEASDGWDSLAWSPDGRYLVYHDSPEITDEDKLRISACITVPGNTAVEGEVGKMAIPGGKYALARFELGADEFQDAWDYVCGTWLPDSGYQPDDRPCFELYYNDPEEHPQKKFLLDVCVPAKPL